MTERTYAARVRERTASLFAEASACAAERDNAEANAALTEQRVEAAQAQIAQSPAFTVNAYSERVLSGAVVEVRSNNFTPSRDSSASMRRATVEWLTLSDAPAARTEPERAKARKCRTSSQSSVSPKYSV